jgi:50S ribosomal protein L16 3-hydroxylase
LDVVDRCRWSTLCEILAQAPDVVVADRGRVADRPAPLDAASLEVGFGCGLGLVVRRAERHDAGLAEVARAIERELGGDVHIQLFATPSGQRMFGWHFDAEQVIVVQTEGSKEYLLRDNTVCRAARFDRDPPFARVREEQSETLAVTMHVGDWLHIPSPWWHIAEALEPSLHLSIGVSGSDPPRARFPKFR